MGHFHEPKRFFVLNSCAILPQERDWQKSALVVVSAVPCQRLSQWWPFPLMQICTIRCRFTNVSWALQNNFAKIYNARKHIYGENFMLKLLRVPHPLDTHTEFLLGFLILQYTVVRIWEKINRTVYISKEYFAELAKLLWNIPQTSMREIIVVAWIIDTVFFTYHGYTCIYTTHTYL